MGKVEDKCAGCFSYTAIWADENKIQALAHIDRWNSFIVLSARTSRCDQKIATLFNYHAALGRLSGLHLYETDKCLSN